MKPVKFHDDAETEMIEAALWYEKQQADLGKRFLASIQNAINKISINPLIYPAVESDVRRCLIKTFPFGVLFRDKPKRIEIIAVMHLHRNPFYWKERVVGWAERSETQQNDHALCTNPFAAISLIILQNPC